MAGGLRKPPPHRPKASPVSRNRRVPTLVRTGTAHRTLRRRQHQASSGSRKPIADTSSPLGRITSSTRTGKSSAEILSILEHRMANDAPTELREAAEQQTPDHPLSPAPLAGVHPIMSITTHILDTSLGRPAAGVPLTLARRIGGHAPQQTLQSPLPSPMPTVSLQRHPLTTRSPATTARIAYASKHPHTISSTI